MPDMVKSKPVTVGLIFRNSRTFFSIEKVFSILMPFLNKDYDTYSHVVPYQGANLWSIIRNLNSLRAIEADIYHVTGDIHYAVFAFPRNRTILTIHDLVFLHQNSGFKRKILELLFLKWPVRKARIVTTISEYSKSEIVKFANCDPDKVIVIPNPVDSNITFSHLSFNSSCPRLLFVGTTPNKNLERVAEAIKSISCTLDVIGPLSNKQRNLLEELNIRYTNSHGISDAELARKYYESDMVVFPSTFEGFGLPILEGQRAGRVVVTSNISPMKEVAGNGACLVDPYSVHSIREGVMKVITREYFRIELINRGLENTKRYEPGPVANQYVSLYHQIIQNVEAHIS